MNSFTGGSRHLEFCEPAVARACLVCHIFCSPLPCWLIAVCLSPLFRFATFRSQDTPHANPAQELSCIRSICPVTLHQSFSLPLPFNPPNKPVALALFRYTPQRKPPPQFARATSLPSSATLTAKLSSRISSPRSFQR